MQTNFEILKELLFLNDDLKQVEPDEYYFIDALLLDRNEDGYLVFVIGYEDAYGDLEKISKFRTNEIIDTPLSRTDAAQFICANFEENDVLQIIEEIREFIETHAKQNFERYKFVSLVREFFPLVRLYEKSEETTPLDLFSEDTDKIPYPFFEESKDGVLTFVFPHYEKEGNVTVEIKEDGETTFSLYGAWDKLPLYENFLSYYEVKLLEGNKSDVRKILTIDETKILLHACKEYAAKYLPELR